MLPDSCLKTKVFELNCIDVSHINSKLNFCWENAVQWMSEWIEPIRNRFLSICHQRKVSIVLDFDLSWLRLQTNRNTLITSSNLTENVNCVGKTCKRSILWNMQMFSGWAWRFKIAIKMEDNKPVLHLLVVGFHHKKGCQVGGLWFALLQMQWLFDYVGGVPMDNVHFFDD